MKTATSGMLSHLNSDTTTICTCWQVTRQDGTILAFTDHDQDLTIAGVTYTSSDGYTRSAIKSDSTVAVDNLEVIGILDSEAINDADIINGLYDYALVEMFIVNWRDLTQGIVKLRSGWLGEVVQTPTGVFHAELRGLTQALSTSWGDLFSPICRADLGDSQCTFNLSSVTFTNTVTVGGSYNVFSATPFQFVPFQSTNTASVIVNNAMTFANADLGIRITLNGVDHDFTVPYGANYVTAINVLVTNINGAAIGVNASAFFSSDNINAVNMTISDVSIEASVTPLNDTGNNLIIQSFSDNYFDNGVIQWLTGANAGVSMEIKSYIGQTVTLFLRMNFEIMAGDTFKYSPGCDKRRETCYYKFNNMVNFRGEPDMPGTDIMQTYPEFGKS